MAMTIPAGHVRSLPFQAGFDGLRDFWRAHRERRAIRAALRRAGRLGPRLLADMGIDPRITGDDAGGWDGLRPNGFLVQSVEGRR